MSLPMTTSLNQLSTSIEYPDTDGKPMAESDRTRKYFQYDPTGDYLNPRLQGARLAEGNYQAIAATTLPNGVLLLCSEVLGLDLRLQAGKLRFYNPVTGQTLLTHEEEVQRSQRLAAKLRELNIDPDAL
jgi:hypothetical protein